MGEINITLFGTLFQVYLIELANSLNLYVSRKVKIIRYNMENSVVKLDKITHLFQEVRPCVATHVTL